MINQVVQYLRVKLTSLYLGAFYHSQSPPMFASSGWPNLLLHYELLLAVFLDDLRRQHIPANRQFAATTSIVSDGGLPSNPLVRRLSWMSSRSTSDVSVLSCSRGTT